MRAAEARGQLPQGLVHHRADRPQGVVLGDPLLGLDVAPHAALLGIAAAHPVASA